MRLPASTSRNIEVVIGEPGAVSIASVRFLDSSLSGCPLAAAMVAEVEKSGEAWFGSSNMGWQGFFPAQRFVLANDGRRHQPAYCSSVEIAQGGKDKGRLMKGDAEVRAIVNFRHGRSSNGQMAVRL
ncbi:hypothetical protein [Rhizobium sp. OAE497]|uniref:hypothetical protein n=1 Tax=Rhizobium sp. OAE497 TaxID=2663796 RepID=UPI001A226042